MTRVLTDLVMSDENLQKEIKTDVKYYMKIPCTLEDLEKLDEQYIIASNFQNAN